MNFSKTFLKTAMVLAGAVACQFAQAKVVLPACFTDHMVLQQKTQVNIWGKADAGKSVTVTTSWNNKKYTAAADGSGNWKVKVATPVFGGPYTLSFNDGETTMLNDVLIGEVWLCSGQSNMEMILSGFYGNVINLNDEVAAANYPQIRTLKIANTYNTHKQTDLKTVGDWRVCSPATVKDFSAVAYFFARDIYNKTHVPIGLINSTWGGTVAEAWTSGDALKKMPAFAPSVTDFESGVSQEELNARFEKVLRKWMDGIAAVDPLKLEWIKEGFNSSAWPKLKVPVLWEKAGINDFDGSMAFRKKVTIPASWAGKDLSLKLGSIDDFDLAWFNGAEVGHTELFIYKRNYTIPGKLVKAGENTIAIRVIDNGGAGGFDGGPMSLAPVDGSAEAMDLAGDWDYHMLNKLTELPIQPNRPDGANRATLIYNTQINPIINYTIKGAIWYQGESNAGRADQYRTLFPLMINDWRQKWGQGNFPFYFVQLASFMPPDKQPGESEWAELREAQTKTLSLPNTGMAVITDAGEVYNIHPANKQAVGHRLALNALAKTYGEKVEYSGPMYKSFKVNGSNAEVSFDFANGLKAKGDKLTGFAIAGADKKFYWADAKVEGGKVIVSSPQVTAPVAVRYAWSNFPECNLYNGADLPASPFRTDVWPGVTVGKE